MLQSDEILVNRVLATYWGKRLNTPQTHYSRYPHVVQEKAKGPKIPQTHQKREVKLEVRASDVCLKS